MRAGPLRQLITVERNDGIPDSQYGSPSTTWDTVCSFRGEIKPLSGRELEFAKQISANVTHQVRTRWQDGFLVSDRLNFNDRIFGILSILNVEERGIEMQILCSENVG